MRSHRAHTFNHAWPFRLFGLVLVLCSGMLHLFGGADFQQGTAGLATLWTAGIGVALMLLKYETRVSGQSGQVVWRLGFLFLWAPYRCIPFHRVISFVVKHRLPQTHTTNNQVRTRPPMWDVMLRFHTESDPPTIEEQGVAMFSENKEEAARQCAVRLTRIVDRHRAASQSPVHR